MMMMKKSPKHPKYNEASYYDAYGFDLQEDFSQFLEEARQHEMTEAKVKSSSIYPEKEENGKKEKKMKKKSSWRFSSVVSWWNNKAEKKKSMSHVCEETKGKMKKKKEGNHVSGPIYNISSDFEKGPNNVKKQWRSNSGPLITALFFKTTKKEKEENEIPYVSLHHQENSPQHVDNYGPLYVVS